MIRKSPENSSATVFGSGSSSTISAVNSSASPLSFTAQPSPLVDDERRVVAVGDGPSGRDATVDVARLRLLEVDVSGKHARRPGGLAALRHLQVPDGLRDAVDGDLQLVLAGLDGLVWRHRVEVATVHREELVRVRPGGPVRVELDDLLARPAQRHDDLEAVVLAADGEFPGAEWLTVMVAVSPRSTVT